MSEYTRFSVGMSSKLSLQKDSQRQTRAHSLLPFSKYIAAYCNALTVLLLLGGEFSFFLPHKRQYHKSILSKKCLYIGKEGEFRLVLPYTVCLLDNKTRRTR